MPSALLYIMIICPININSNSFRNIAYILFLRAATYTFINCNKSIVLFICIVYTSKIYNFMNTKVPIYFYILCFSTKNVF